MCGKGCGYCCGCCDPTIKTCWSPCFWHSTVRYLALLLLLLQRARALDVSSPLHCLHPKIFTQNQKQIDLILIGYNLTLLSTGQEVMLWLVTLWAWHFASSPTLLISCRSHIMLSKTGASSLLIFWDITLPSGPLHLPPVLIIFTGRWFKPVLPASLRDGDPFIKHHWDKRSTKKSFRIWMEKCSLQGSL